MQRGRAFKGAVKSCGAGVECTKATAGWVVGRRAGRPYHGDMPEQDDLICLRADAPPFDASKGAEGLPKRILVLAWGAHDTTQGKVICNDTTMKLLSAYNESKNWDRIALDFEHSSVPISPTYQGEPVKVAGYGKLELVPNEGVYLLMSSWTSEGKEFGAGGHYGDLSPVVKCNKQDEVIGLHSVALCRHGATPGLVFLSAAAVGKTARVKPITTRTLSTMDPKPPQSADELLSALQTVLGLAAESTPADVFAGVTAKLKAAPAAAAEGDDTKILSSGILEIKDLLKAQGDTIKAQDERIKLLSSGVETSERTAILSAATREGKQVPASAAKSMPLADLKLLCAELPVTVPMDKRTPDAATLLLSSGLGEDPEMIALDKSMGITPEDRKKHLA
jgi:phage I-like protein